MPGQTFVKYLSGAAPGIFFATNVQLAFGIDAFEIIRSGESRVNIDGSFSSFLKPSINSAETVVFNARLFDTSAGNLANSGFYRFRVPSGIGPAVVSHDEVAGLLLLLDRRQNSLSPSVQPVTLPGAAWLLLSGLLMLK